MQKIPTLRKTIGRDKGWGFLHIAQIRRPSRHASNDWNRQNNYALNILLDGAGRLVDSSGAVHDLRLGSVYQHVPNTGWELSWNSEEVEEAFLILDRSTYTRLESIGYFPRRIDWRVNDPGAIHAILANGRMQLDGIPPSHFSYVNRRLFASLLGVLAACFDYLEPVPGFLHKDPIVAKACQHFDLRPGDRTPMPELAIRWGVSHSTLRRRFTELIGVSANEYRIRARIDAARRLLLEKDVQSTAELLGYPDAFSFSSQFKKRTGQAPRHYRDMLRR